MGALALVALGGTASAQGPADRGPRANWHFRFPHFVIGAWWGPGPTDAEVKLYRECGFNVVMTGRYMQVEDYGDPVQALAELELAHRHGLGVMFDTYTKNERPWGGVAGETDEHPLHHPASLVELEWLYERVGTHPALVGFMIGDDQGSVSGRAADCTRFLYEQGPPHLFPWLCGWISPANLAEHNNPIENPQIYPTLYSWEQSAEQHAQAYAAAYAGFSRQCRDHGLLFWPMFNAGHWEHGKTADDMFGYCASDSLLRLPGYLALAYGAQGIWYFTYNGGALQHFGRYETEDEVRAALTPLYEVAQLMNRRIAAWGPRLMGRTSTGLFGTAFGAKAPDWPFAEDTQTLCSAEALTPPAPGKLVESMDDGLVVGILTAHDEPPLAMVVNVRTGKRFAEVPPRNVSVRFSTAVTGIKVLAGSGPRRVRGSRLTIGLEAGGGQLLELEGKGLDALAAEDAIYAAPTRCEEALARPVTKADLATARAAKLRIDIFGSDGGEYAAKFIDLNGDEIGRVPAGGGDSWRLAVVDLDPSQLERLCISNQIVVRTAAGDAWKFRNLTLAVQLADGTWVRTPTDPTVHSCAGWAFSEGELWGDDRVAGPIVLAFQ